MCLRLVQTPKGEVTVTITKFAALPVIEVKCTERHWIGQVLSKVQRSAGRFGAWNTPIAVRITWEAAISCF